MALNAQGVDGGGLIAAAETLARPSEEFGNDSRVEALWAMKAMKQAEIYFNILCSVDPKQIPRLSPCDDEIYERFRKDFPDMKVAKLDEVKDLKSEERKVKWRQFCQDFSHVEDFSFATLLRLDSSQDYEEVNTVIATKVQFYAIELARNREGHNDQVRIKFKPSPRRSKKNKQAEEASHASQQQEMMGKEIEQELKNILSGNHALMK